MSAIQKPTWHYGGTFDAAWNGTARMGDRAQEENPDLSRDCALTLKLLKYAHVVTLDIEQYLALPTSYDERYETSCYRCQEAARRKVIASLAAARLLARWADLDWKSLKRAAQVYD